MIQTQNLSVDDIRRLIVFAVLFAALVYLVIQFISAIAGIVILFSLVAIITLVLNPIVGWLEKHKIPRVASAAALAILVLGSIGLAAALLIPPIIVQSRDLVTGLPHYFAVAQEWVAHRAGSLGIHVRHINPSEAIGYVFRRGAPIVSRIGTYTLSAVGLVASGLVLFISVIYTLASPRPLLEGLLKLAKPAHRDKVSTILQQLAVQMRSWALSLLAGMIAIGLLTWIALGLVLHIPYAFLFAVIAGLMEIVPIVGPIISAVPPALVALAIDPVLTLWVILAFLIIQQFENHLLVPLIMAEGVQLHPVSVIFSVMVMGGLFGLIGVFLAVPTAATVKTIIESFYETPEPPEKARISEKVEEIISGENQSAQ